MTPQLFTTDDVKESAYPWPLQPNILNFPVCPDYKY